ncbi:hypothetical protein ACEV7Y_23175, partial [Vibrio parahaemolyticus]
MRHYPLSFELRQGPEGPVMPKRRALIASVPAAARLHCPLRKEPNGVTIAPVDSRRVTGWMTLAYLSFAH